LLYVSVPEDPRRVIVQKLAILVDGRPDMEVDLTGNSSLLISGVTGILREVGGRGLNQI